MSQDSKGAAIEGDKEDVISDLPRNVINGILELLPVQEAARTSILSKKWSHIWSELPYLVLDRSFREGLTEKSYSFFEKTVYAILLLHRGDIVKFVLDAPEEPLSSYKEPFSSYKDIDRWILYVTRNGVKELSLSMSHAYEWCGSYELPSYVFGCTTLTHLQLDNCIFRPPHLSLAFPKLETLHLEGITIVPTTDLCILNVPCLVSLNLIHSDGTQYLNIVSPLLELLHVHDVHYLVLNCFMNCRKLKELYLRYIKMDNLKHDVRSTLKMLLFSLAPTLETLYLDVFILELLSADRIPKGPISIFNCLQYLSLMVEFDELSPVSGGLQLIMSIPNLSELEIVVKATSNDAESLVKYLNSPACLNQKLNKLKHVDIHWFKGSIIEVLFIRLLLACTPSLVRMSIWQESPFDSRKESIITDVLASFPRASSESQLFLQNYID